MALGNGRERPGGLRRLHHADVVSGGIAECRVGAVRLLRRLLLEFDAPALELLVVACTSSVEKKRPLVAPLASNVWIWSRVSSSNTGGPGTAMRVMATSGCPGTPTLSQRKLPSSGTVTSSRSSIPSFSV
jgi:hypothetical protein